MSPLYHQRGLLALVIVYGTHATTIVPVVATMPPMPAPVFVSPTMMTAPATFCLPPAMRMTITMPVAMTMPCIGPVSVVAMSIVSWTVITVITAFVGNAITVVTIIVGHTDAVAITGNGRIAGQQDAAQQSQRQETLVCFADSHYQPPFTGVYPVSVTGMMKTTRTRMNRN